MQNLIRFIIRFSFQIIFVILEVFALALLFRNNPLPNARLYQATQGMNSFFYNQTSQLTKFFNLTTENAALVTENARLRHELARMAPLEDRESFKTLANPAYSYDFIPARVINNTVNKQNNYITLDVGTLQGVRPDMGVVGPQGIVGMVRSVSPNFSTVIPVLNSKFRGSVKLAVQGYFGTLSWPGHSYREAIVSEIPSHVIVYEGDTLITSGLTSIFPEGEIAGFVTKVDRTPAGSFFELKVRLSQDFKKLTRVYVIRNFSKTEMLRLEEQTYD
ncbi:MAG: rod shape-determining protein MreC [Bacteroidetes bacterium GWF2_49_14]|nr:MAG: rod shape-determining protein MreC [Bacteroidetes bacterium GWF2_49_14]HBB92957.1 rod shape-determining protein MreC [Bacteroidales bacterium]